MQLLCLGSLDCFPKKGNDSASYLLDQHILIDTGWATVNNLLNLDMDPLAVSPLAAASIPETSVSRTRGILSLSCRNPVWTSLSRCVDLSAAL